MTVQLALQLLELLLIGAILMVDLLLLLDSREIKQATIHYWAERSDWYARRLRQAQANVAPPPDLADPQNPAPLE
jgi:hypothetical protein